MKRTHLFPVLMAALTLAATGCNKSAKKQSQADTLTTDSVVYLGLRDSTVECTIRIDYPNGSDSLSTAVKNFIGHELASLYLPRNNGDENEIKQYPLYTGSALEGQKMTDYYGAGTMKYLADCFTLDYYTKLSCETTIKKDIETPEYVTYTVTQQTYLGGAHGSYTTYSVNISKHSFSPMYHPIDSTLTSDIQPILRKGIIQYLNDCGEEVTDSTLNDNLMLPIENNGIIPLPVHAPYLQNDSLYFVYQQYEIASYALGLISFGVAYNDIKAYLSEEMKEIREQKQ